MARSDSLAFAVAGAGTVSALLVRPDNARWLLLLAHAKTWRRSRPGPTREHITLRKGERAEPSLAQRVRCFSQDGMTDSDSQYEKSPVSPSTAIDGLQGDGGE